MERVRHSASQGMEEQRREYEGKLKRQARKAREEKENVCENRDEKQRIEQLAREVDRLNLKIKSLEHEKKASDGERERLAQLVEAYQQRSKEEEDTSELLAHQGRG